MPDAIQQVSEVFETLWTDFVFRLELLSRGVILFDTVMAILFLISITFIIAIIIRDPQILASFFTRKRVPLWWMERRQIYPFTPEEVTMFTYALSLAAHRYNLERHDIVVCGYDKLYISGWVNICMGGDRSQIYQRDCVKGTPLAKVEVLRRCGNRETYYLFVRDAFQYQQSCLALIETPEMCTHPEQYTLGPRKASVVEAS